MSEKLLTVPEIAEPENIEGDEIVPDIEEPAEESDPGIEEDYVPGEEEAEDYEDPENDTPDPEYTDESSIADQDAVQIPKGINYILDNGALKVNTGLNGDLSSWATVYASEPDKLVEFKYNAGGLRTQKKITTEAGVETTEYTLHGKLITHLTAKKKLADARKPRTRMHVHVIVVDNHRFDVADDQRAVGCGVVRRLGQPVTQNFNKFVAVGHGVLGMNSRKSALDHGDVFDVRVQPLHQNGGHCAPGFHGLGKKKSIV